MFVGIFTVFFIYLDGSTSCRGADYGYYYYYNSYGGGAYGAGEEAVGDAPADAGEDPNAVKDPNMDDMLKWDKDSNMSKNDHLQLLKNIKLAWGGFEVPDDVKLEWKNWLETYKYNLKQQEDNENVSAYDRERGPGSGWPDAWQGFGGGYAGSPPGEAPPWGYVPVNVGAPAHCRERPRKGACNESLVRWAFNPYMDKCITFTYSGCKGNKNNFLTELKCEEQCLTPVPPSSGCDFETQIHIEDYLIDENHRRSFTRKCVYDKS